MSPSVPADAIAGETAADLAMALCASLGCEVGAGRLQVSGAEPVLAARCPLATRAAAVLGAIGLAAAALRSARAARRRR